MARTARRMSENWPIGARRFLATGFLLVILSIGLGKVNLLGDDRPLISDGTIRRYSMVPELPLLH